MKEKTPCRRPFFPIEDYSYISKKIEDDLSLLPKPNEGHISPQQAEFLYYFIRLIRPEFVVETGFGVGHSAIVIMHAQQSIGIEPCLMSVDICEFKETRIASTLLKKKFKNFFFIEGNSKNILQSAVNNILREREGLKLQLGIADGGHDAETCMHDLNTLYSFLTLGGYLWLDDFEKIVPNSGSNMAGRTFARKWGNCQRFRTHDTRGFMLHQKSF